MIGYEAGVDDHISKPFSLSVLMLKLEAYVRRLSVSLQSNSPKSKEQCFHSGDICFDSERMEVTSGEEQVSLTKNEVKLDGRYIMYRFLSFLPLTLWICYWYYKNRNPLPIMIGHGILNVATAVNILVTSAVPGVYEMMM